MMSECEIASVINMSEPTPLDAAGENWSRRGLEKRDVLWRRGWCREHHALSHDKGERIDRLIASFQADHAAVRSERPEWIWPRCFAIPPPEGISLPLIRQSLSRRAGSSKTLLVLWRMRRWFRWLIAENGRSLYPCRRTDRGCKYLWLSHFCGRAGVHSTSTAHSPGRWYRRHTKECYRPTSSGVFYHSDRWPIWTRQSQPERCKTHRSRTLRRNAFLPLILFWQDWFWYSRSTDPGFFS